MEDQELEYHYAEIPIATGVAFDTPSGTKNTFKLSIPEGWHLYHVQFVNTALKTAEVILVR